jgi:hypothetical protein
MTTTQTETQKADSLTLEEANAAIYPSTQKWFDQKIGVSNKEFYKFYLERSDYKMTKSEWMQFMKSFSTNFFNYLCSGVNHVLPFNMGEMRMTKIKVNGKQINWNESKLKFKELHGRTWVKGDPLKDCYVYHPGATKKETFHLNWDDRAAKVAYKMYWKFHISSRYQWKRILRMFTEYPSMLNKLRDATYR